MAAVFNQWNMANMYILRRPGKSIYGSDLFTVEQGQYVDEEILALSNAGTDYSVFKPNIII